VPLDNATAHIDGSCIVIRCRIDALPSVVEGAWAAGGLETRLKITDPAAFAKDVVSEMNQEDEIGTTPVHRLFDKAIKLAFDRGAEGVEEHEDQEVGRP